MRYCFQLEYARSTIIPFIQEDEAENNPVTLLVEQLKDLVERSPRWRMILDLINNQIMPIYPPYKICISGHNSALAANALPLVFNLNHDRVMLNLMNGLLQKPNFGFVSALDLHKNAAPSFSACADISFSNQQSKSSRPTILVPDTPPFSSPQIDITDPIMEYGVQQPDHNISIVLVHDTPPLASSTPFETIDPIMSFADKPETTNPRVLVPNSSPLAPYSSTHLEPAGPDAFIPGSSPLTSLYGPTFPTDPNRTGLLNLPDDNVMDDETWAAYIEDSEEEVEDPEITRAHWTVFQEMLGMQEWSQQDSRRKFSAKTFIDASGYNGYKDKEKERRGVDVLEKEMHASEQGPEEKELHLQAILSIGHNPRTSPVASPDMAQELDLRAEAFLILIQDSYTPSGLDSDEASHFLAALLTLSQERRFNILSLSHMELSEVFNITADEVSTKWQDIEYNPQLETPSRTSFATSPVQQELELRVEALSILKQDSFTPSGLDSEEASHFLAALLALSQSRRFSILSLSHMELSRTFNMTARGGSKRRRDNKYMDSPERKRIRQV